MKDFRFWWWVPLPSVAMMFIILAWAQSHGAEIIWPRVWVVGLVVLIFGWLICWSLGKTQ